MISIIAAVAHCNAIGQSNALLVRIAEDMQRFRTLTLGNIVIMGRLTFASIGRALPERRNIVLSRSICQGSGAEWAQDLDSALLLCGKSDVFIIGGANVYSQALPRAERIYLTRIFSYFEADTFFPQISDLEWQQTHCEHRTENRAGRSIKFNFEVFERIFNK